MTTEPQAPDWLKYKGKTFNRAFNVINKSVKRSSVATVCEAASCPNKTECWSGGTATFMLMGDTCTRGCRFCKVKTSRFPEPLNSAEPDELVAAIREWGGLKYLVITSVDRDDIDDGGSQHLAECISRVVDTFADLKVEILIPDFCGIEENITRIIDAGPVVVAHNIETVRRLSPRVRDRRAGYDQSLSVLRYIKQYGKSLSKSSIMLGFGETEEEVVETMNDLRDVGVDIITIGQYMRPSMKHLPVKEYISLEDFEKYKLIGEKLGFLHTISAPLSRSSYRAGEIFIANYLSSQ